MSKSPYTVLGLSFGHGDSSAALIVDNKLVAAAEEERFVRIKHYAPFPANAIQYCLKHAGINPSDVRTVAIAKNPKGVWLKKALIALKHPYLAGTHKNGMNNKKAPSLSANLRKLGIKRADLYKVEHHFAHMMSARFLSGQKETAIFSFDGLGDFVSAAFGHSDRDSANILHRVFYPHSLGFFYTAMTQYLGFPYFGDEFKVMGLSAYGQPTYLKEMRELVRIKDPMGFELNLEAFPIEKSMNSFYLENDQPYVKPIFHKSFITQLTGVPPRRAKEPLDSTHWNFAKSVQVHFEEVASHCLKQLHKKTGGETISLAGGCAHNSVWVGKIPQMTPFKNVFVAPASHDAGIAVGAAISATKRDIIPENNHWALLGPSVEEFPDTSLGSFAFEVNEHTFPNDKKLCQWMVDELCDGKIIGLMHGRLEFGPRALGNRSIIADPRVKEMKERLNERVKHREPFRPFAASVLKEHQEKWFKDSFYAPAMDAVFQVQDSMRSKVPAVVHNDHSCRIQSVEKETQPFYWLLIETFRQKTGVPMLLNTSFNDCEPVVCSPTDAINCFANTDLDHLVVGNKVVSRANRTALSA